LPVAVVSYAHSGAEPEFHCSLADDQGIFRVLHPAAHHGIDVHVELCVGGKQFKLLIEHLEALLRDLVGIDVVDADLQVIQSGTVQALDAIGDQKITIGNHARNQAVTAYVGDDVIELGMQQTFPATDGNNRGPEVRQMIHSAQYGFQRHRLGDIVELVAVRTGQIAAAHGHKVGQHRMIGGDQTFGNHAQFTYTAVDGGDSAAKRAWGIRHSITNTPLHHTL
jgi:hypothetical protein